MGPFRRTRDCAKIIHTLARCRGFRVRERKENDLGAKRFRKDVLSRLYGGIKVARAHLRPSIELSET